MIKCILVKIDNSFSVVELPDDNTFNDEVYKLLDCTCWEGVNTALSLYMLVDENGKISKSKKDINFLASLLTLFPLENYVLGDVPNDAICGDVLISKVRRNEYGECALVSLTDIDIKQMSFLLEETLEVIKES